METIRAASSYVDDRWEVAASDLREYRHELAECVLKLEQGLEHAGVLQEYEIRNALADVRAVVIGGRDLEHELARRKFERPSVDV